MPQPLTWDSQNLAFDAPDVFWDGEAPNQTPTTMPDSNRISATMTSAAVTAVSDAIDTIRTNMPFLLSLTPDERRGMP